MVESFIEQTKQKHQNRGNEYEDYLIAGEVEHVKSMIEDAVKKNRNNFTWMYWYDDYDSCIFQEDDLYKEDSTVIQYFDVPPRHGVGSFNNHNGLGHYLGEWKNHSLYGEIPVAPDEINYDYLKEELKKELYKLGCKAVRMKIGPIVKKEQVLVKKGIFKNTYKDISITINMWLVSISW